MAGEHDISRRLLRSAEFFLGRAYTSYPFGGGPKEAETLVVDLDTFDCVTYIEVAFAVARSRSRRGFIDELRKTRYRDGRVDWRTRLHYFSDWMRYNQKRGALKIRTRGAGSYSVEAALGLIQGLPERRARFHVVPKREIRRALGRISDGTIVAFASVRSRLDFFHTGMLFFRAPDARSEEDLMLYQAARSVGKVFREPLSVFLKRNRMRGIAFAAPLGMGDTK